MTKRKMFSDINEILQNDGVIAFVTDTVWGIGCLPSSEKAVQRIYEIKKREAKKPLILMSDDVYPLFDYVKQPIEKQAQKLIKDHFPGALTLVVEKSENTPDYITSNMNTVGIRVPDNETFANICRNIDARVLATTSANISGEAPALTYEEALNYIGDKVDLVIPDYGCVAKGKASTVVGFNDGEVVIFRQGEIQL
ncbi:MAG: threonylcarbamoyl-AMP synthase [Cyanobacteria bacterium SIG32]|nr:threonylcarbamoyl-AMP synthase [Cyanobacteria bacterium SIG32]